MFYIQSISSLSRPYADMTDADALDMHALSVEVNLEQEVLKEEARAEALRIWNGSVYDVQEEVVRIAWHSNNFEEFVDIYAEWYARS